MEEKPKCKSRFKWFVIGLVLAIAYPLSYGPAVRLSFSSWDALELYTAYVQPFYGPLVWLHHDGPGPVSDLLEWYVQYWAPINDNPCGI